MENSVKSVEDKSICQNKEQSGIDEAEIFEPRVEREIKNISITEHHEFNEPSCSHQNPYLKPNTLVVTNNETNNEVLKLSSPEYLSTIKSPEIVFTEEKELKTFQGKTFEKTSSICSCDHNLNQKNNLSCPDIIPNLFDDLESITSTTGNNAITIEQTQKRNVDNIALSLEQPAIQSREDRGLCFEPTTNMQNQILLLNNVPSVIANNHPQPHNPTRGRTLMNDCLEVSRMHPIHRREPVSGPPPSYSKIALDRRINPCASIQFVAPIPPPSYEGMENELRYVNCSGFTLGLGNTWQFQSQPAYCPICETVTITRTEIRVSRQAHLIALVLFFLLCWPFCFLPYFISVCNYTFHYCSVCHCYLGARRPFQRN